MHTSGGPGDWVFELPCPCWRPGGRNAGGRDSRVLFLLTPQLAISGAAVRGVTIPQVEALQLWQAHAWQPVSEGQVWPAMEPGGQALQQGSAAVQSDPDWG